MGRATYLQATGSSVGLKAGSPNWNANRPAGAGSRFFEGVRAAHRGTADAAGVDWKASVYRKAQEEMKANRGLRIVRMVKLGRVSRSGFYRFQHAEPIPDRDTDLRDAI